MVDICASFFGRSDINYPGNSWFLLSEGSRAEIGIKLVWQVQIWKPVFHRFLPACLPQILVSRMGLAYSNHCQLNDSGCPLRRIEYLRPCPEPKRVDPEGSARKMKKRIQMRWSYGPGERKQPGLFFNIEPFLRVFVFLLDFFYISAIMKLVS